MQLGAHEGMWIDEAYVRDHCRYVSSPGAAPGRLAEGCHLREGTIVFPEGGGEYEVILWDWPRLRYFVERVGP